MLSIPQDALQGSGFMVLAPKVSYTEVELCTMSTSTRLPMLSGKLGFAHALIPSLRHSSIRILEHQE